MTRRQTLVVTILDGITFATAAVAQMAPVPLLPNHSWTPAELVAIAPTEGPADGQCQGAGRHDLGRAIQARSL
jgi:hypothetical protein